MSNMSRLEIIGVICMTFPFLLAVLFVIGKPIYNFFYCLIKGGDWRYYFEQIFGLLIIAIFFIGVFLWLFGGRT